ncbi:hypothetical protein [Rossellomorea marisflavi]|uniref:hypothetical protein n=1 Tax=Rossellomorea marisflavi TaxID=189381 RepID=UPI003FA11200
MTTSKQIKSTKKNRASFIPLAVGVGVGALTGVAIPLQDGTSHIMNVHATDVDAVPSLPKEGAKFLTEIGDISHYNLVLNASSVQYYNGFKWVTATLPGTVFDVKEYKGKLYATASDKYSGQIVRYNEETRTWDKVGDSGDTIYDLIITKDGKFIAGGGGNGTYGTDYGIYSSVDGDSSWAKRVSGYKSNGVYTSENLGVFYTGVAVENSALMFGVSGNWTFIHETQNGKDFTFKQEIYGGYSEAISADGIVVAVGNQATSYDAYGSIATSIDGGDFTVQKMGRLETFNGVTHANGTFVAVGHGANNEGLIESSTDGINWTKASLPSTTKSLNAVDYDEKNKRFVAVGRDGTMMVSQDAKVWVSINTGIKESISNIAFNDNPVTPYDYAVNAFDTLSKKALQYDFKAFTPEVKEAFQTELNGIIDNELKAVTNTETKQKLNDKYVPYIQDRLTELGKANDMYADFQTLKTDVEKMPDTTSEELNVIITKLNSFYNKVFNELAPSYKTSLGNEVLNFASGYKVEYATAYVVKAETTFLESDYLTARNNLNGLPQDIRKDLENRLEVVRLAIPVKKVELLVEKAEKSSSYADYNQAYNQWGVLPQSSGKSELQKRLGFVMVQIADNEVAKVNTKETPEYMDKMRVLTYIQKIPTNIPELKTEFTRLASDLDIIAFKIDAIQVKKTYNELTINTLIYNYGKILDSNPNKSALGNDVKLMAEMKANKETTILAQTAINSPTQENKDKAIPAVQALPDGLLKSFLGQKLGIIADTAKEAETLLSDLKTAYTPEAVAKAKEKIAEVQDASIKQKLTEELEKLVETENVRVTEKTVSEVEETPSYEAVESAKEAVNQLKDVSVKAEMTERLDKVVEKLKTEEATTALSELVKAPSQETFDATMKLIDELKDETVKEDMKAQAEKALEEHLVSQATELISVAKEELTREAYQEASEAVEQLKDGSTKDSLVSDVADILDIIQTKEAQAVVDTVQASPTQESLDNAVDLVNQLKDSKEKEAMQTTLDSIQQELYLSIATDLVNKATETLTQESVDSAKEAVSLIKSGDKKTQLEASIQLTQDIIDAQPVQDMLEAFEEKLDAINKRPKKAEANALTNEYLSIQKEISSLNNGEVKTQLTEDLKDVKETLDAVLKNGNHPAKAPGQLKKTVQTIVGWILHIIFGR